MKKVLILLALFIVLSFCSSAVAGAASLIPIIGKPIASIILFIAKILKSVLKIIIIIIAVIALVKFIKRLIDKRKKKNGTGSTSSEAAGGTVSAQTIIVSSDAETPENVMNASTNLQKFDKF